MEYVDRKAGPLNGPELVHPGGAEQIPATALFTEWVIGQVAQP
jgi:hypothetical protein